MAAAAGGFTTSGAREAAQPSPTARVATSVAVIVRERVPSSHAGALIVQQLGGSVTHQLPIVGGFSARIPWQSLARLRHAREIVGIWPDARVHVSDLGGDANDLYDALPPNTAWEQTIGLAEARSRADGAGVTVALLDTGIADVPDLSGRVVERVDFTTERDGLDRFGHGTHMAGIIGGDGTASGGGFTGVAPGADIVSVKVAGADGSTDVSVVLAGLQWVISNAPRLNIRVLNLSFGTDAVQSYAIDPLDYGIEQVWAAGVLVVVAAGNRGPSPGTIDKPGDDPFVLTVGATAGPGGVENETVAAFSSQGPTPDAFAKPDVVAPGTSIVSLRAPGSTVDVLRPAARVDESYFKGTGTSQATAVASGVAALLFEVDPSLSPDEAKAIITDSAHHELAAQPGGGAGLVDVVHALDEAGTPEMRTLPANSGLTPSNGLGSIEGSRGSFHVLAPLGAGGALVPVVGEIDVLGRPWVAKTWSASLWSASDWIAWLAQPWTSGWVAKTWSAKTWSAKTWSTGAWN